jgi:hypothetical protein
MLQYIKTKTPESSKDSGVFSLLIVDKAIEISNLGMIKDIVRIINLANA